VTRKPEVVDWEVCDDPYFLDPESSGSEALFGYFCYVLEFLDCICDSHLSEKIFSSKNVGKREIANHIR